MTLEEQGRSAAAQFRATNHLGVQPLGDLVALIEQTTGHDVAILDADPEEHGLTMRDPVGGAVFIGVARTPNPMRQRSTLAHELAHVVFGDWAEQEDPADRPPTEIRADAFARHLLVPVEGLKAFLEQQRPLSEADLSAVVQRFLVSPAIAAIALHDSGHIDAATKLEWMSFSTARLATRFGWRDQYQALQNDANQTRAPQRLLTRAIAGYADGVVTAQTIATVRGIAVGEMLAELADAGITPTEHQPPWLAASDLPAVTVDLSALNDSETSEDLAV